MTIHEQARAAAFWHFDQHYREMFAKVLANQPRETENERMLIFTKFICSHPKTGKEVKS